MARIVTYVHHCKRPPKKKPKAPAIAQAVVTTRRTDAKSKAAATAKKSAIVTSISRKEAEFMRHARGAEHDVEDRDDHTEEAITARYRTLIARKLQPEKFDEEIEGPNKHRRTRCFSPLRPANRSANRPLSSRSSGPTCST